MNTMTDKEKDKLTQEVIGLRSKAMAFTRKHFSLTETECEDVCQEAFKTFYEKINDCKSSTLSSFFLGICKNKAREELRRKKKMLVDEGATIRIEEDRLDDNRINQILTLDSEPSFDGQRNSLVESIIKDLPHPCNKLLWGWYWDCLSFSVLAAICSLKNGDVAKTTLSQCRKKFKLRYQKESSSLY